MTTTIQVLLIILLLCGILAVLRFYFVLGEVRRTLASVETTRQQVTGTLERVETLIETTETMLREEVAPTLQAARATIGHLETATRAVAGVGALFGGKGGKVPLSLGGIVGGMVARRGADAAGGLLSGLVGRVRGLLGRGEPEKTKPAPRLPAGRAKSLPAARPINEILLPDDTELPVKTGGNRK